LLRCPPRGMYSNVTVPISLCLQPESMCCALFVLWLCKMSRPNGISDRVNFICIICISSVQIPRSKNHPSSPHKFRGQFDNWYCKKVNV
jgi:hypothetical protein